MLEELSEINNFLRAIHLFRKTPPDQVKELASEMDEIILKEGERLYDVGADSDAFYFVFRGRLREMKVYGSKEAVTRTLVTGDYFGEEDLLAKRPRTTGVVAEADTRLLRWKAPFFYQRLRRYAGFRADLQLVIDSRKLAGRLKLKWLNPGEVVYYITRRHPFLLVQGVFLPVMLLLGGFILFPILSLVMPGTVSALLCPGGTLLAGLLWLAWGWLDWGNDYYILTNQRVVWVEKVIALYDSRVEATLNTLLSVTLETSYAGRSFGFGDVIVRTYTMPIVLRNIANPERVSRVIEEHWARSKTYDLAAETQAMESAIRRKLGLEKPSAQTAAPAPKERATPFSVYHPGEIQKFISNFFRLRYVEGTTITYRTHWYILLRRTWQPVFVALLGVVALFLRFFGMFTFPSIVSTIAVFLIFIAAVAVWYGYNYVDWANDLFQVTPEQVVDINRKPFGQEERKAAPLENVLQITYERVGLTGLLLNFGTVRITVGGTQFVFRDVYDPASVQQDIFYRMGERVTEKRQKEAEAERERVSEWIATYHRSLGDITRLEEEQKREQEAAEKKAEEEREEGEGS